MDLTIIVIGWVVTGAVAVYGSYQAVKRANDERERKYADSIARVETKIDTLSTRVEKHNNVIERTYKLETEVENLYHRYDELHSDMKDLKIGGTE